MGTDKDRLRGILGVSQSDCDALLRSAADAYVENDLEAAETQLRGLIVLTDDPRPVKLLAAVLHHRQRHEEAARLYEEARRQDPDDPFVLVALGELRLRSLEFEQAIPLLEKVIDAHPVGTHPAADRARLLVGSYCEQLEAAGHDV